MVFHYAPVLHFLCGPELAQKIAEYRLDANPPRAARAYALVSVACFDATVACWEAKFFYMTARPVKFDPDITTVLPTYPIPDYPSGHATTLGGTAEVLAYLFPRDADYFRSRAVENAAPPPMGGYSLSQRLRCRIATRAGCRPGGHRTRSQRWRGWRNRAVQDGAAGMPPLSRPTRDLLTRASTFDARVRPLRTAYVAAAVRESTPSLVRM